MAYEKLDENSINPQLELVKLLDDIQGMNDPVEKGTEKITELYLDANKTSDDGQSIDLNLDNAKDTNPLEYKIEVTYEYINEPGGLSLSACQKCSEYFASEYDLNTHTCYNDINDTPDKSINNSARYSDTILHATKKTFDNSLKSNLKEKKAKSAAKRKIQKPRVKKEQPNTGKRRRKLGGPHVCNICNKGLSRKAILRDHIKRNHSNENKFDLSAFASSVLKSIDEIIKGEADDNSDKGKQKEKMAEADLQDNNEGNDADTTPPQEERKKSERNDGGPHICELCNKKFTRRASLTVHLRRHKKDMPFECEHCKKGFVVLCDLDRHMVVHTGEKKYTCFCDLCNRPFFSKPALLMHKKMAHADYKFYTCDVCGMMFCRKSELVSHETTHNEKKGAEVEYVLYDPNPQSVFLLYGVDSVT